MHRSAVGEGKGIRAREGEVYAVLGVSVVGVIGHGGSPPAVPGNTGLWGPRRGEVALCEQLLGVLSDQEGTVRPLADEGRIIQRLFEQDVDHGQGQGTVATRSHPQPEVRFVDHAGLVRVDDDEWSTPRFRPADPHGVGGLRRLGVVAPEEHAACVLVVRLRRAQAVGILCTAFLMPAAEMVGVQDVGAAKGVGQTLHPGEEVGSRGACTRRTPEYHRLGPVPGLDVSQTRGRQSHRLVPGDAHPTGVALPLGAGASHGILQAVGGVDNLGGRRALDADTPVGMLGVGGHLGQSPVLDGSHDAASGLTHRTVGVHLLGGHGEPSLPVVSARRDLQLRQAIC